MPLASTIAAVGALAGGALSAAGQSKANKKTAKIAQKNRRFQRKMSNTAFRRGMRDMKKAGLNPILAYQKGGASQPTGATAVMQNEMAAMPDAAKGVTNAMQLALNAKQTKANTDNLEANTRLADANVTTAQAAASNQSAQAAYNSAKAAKTSGIDTQLAHGQLDAALQAADLSFARARELSAAIQKSDVLWKIRSGKSYAAVQWMVEHGLTAANAGKLVGALGKRMGK